MNEGGIKMGNDLMEKRGYEKGFHLLYLWGVLYVFLTYTYPVFWYLTLPNVDETVHSDAAYEAAARAQNGVLGTKLPLLFLTIPLLMLIVNIVIAVKARNRLDRRYFLNTAVIIKYGLIPFYLLGGCLIAIFALLTFTPVVIMIFVGPIVVGTLTVLGWISMIGSAPLTFVYLHSSVKDKKNGKIFAVIIGIMQCFFGLDVLGIVISAFKEKKFIKLTIGIILGFVLVILGLLAWLVITILTSGK